MYMLEIDERMDDLECDNLKIIQKTNGYAFSSDAVLLANFVKGKSGEALLELGSGSGVISFLVYAKTKADSIVGVDIQHQYVEMANRSLVLNNITARLSFLELAIQNLTTKFKSESFDVVFTNPPYFKSTPDMQNANTQIAACRHEVLVTLNEILIGASKMLKFGGRFYMVHKAERLDEVLVKLNQNNLTPKAITFIIPKPNCCIDTFIVEAKKGAKQGVKLNTLLVYDAFGNMTSQARTLYGKT